MDHLEGANLTPWLENPELTKLQPAVTTYQRGNHSVRDERWRYTRYYDGTEELYDHDSDPLEWNNLASNRDYDDIMRSLGQWIPVDDAPNSLEAP